VGLTLGFSNNFSGRNWITKWKACGKKPSWSNWSHYPGIWLAWPRKTIWIHVYVHYILHFRVTEFDSVVLCSSAPLKL
jgi:hypothetical protein